MKNLQNLGKALTKEAQKTIIGGRALQSISEGCPSGEFNCSCNGADRGCVCSIQECWDLC